jgi:hypothetical protein
VSVVEESEVDNFLNKLEIELRGHVSN